LLASLLDAAKAAHAGADVRAKLGVDYLLSWLFFGTMTSARALRSLDLFDTELMRRLADP